MEPQDTAVSSTQIGLGVDLWSTVHMFRESNDPLFDPLEPHVIPKDEIEEILGISEENQKRIVNKAIDLAKSLNENML